MMIYYAVGATEKIFYENELSIIQDEDESNVKIFVFLKVHILTLHTLCCICINGMFLTSF